MKRWMVLLAVGAVCASTVSRAQAVDATVCAVLADSQSFDGKTVRIKGTVIAGFDEFVIVDASCKKPVNAIWLAYPNATKGKAGPAVVVQLALAHNSPGQENLIDRKEPLLDKNKDFKQFDSLLSAPYKGPGRCLGCVKSTVTATLTGRLDGVANAGVEHDAKGMITAVHGFGNLNHYSARLVLMSVSDIVANAIDYSKANALPKSDPDSGGGDPVAAAHAASKVFPAGNPVGGEIERAAAAYGAPGEDNGVDIGFGAANEVRVGEGSKAAGSSPDGAKYFVTMDMERLKGKALGEAIVHTGTHIADYRSGKSDNALYTLEEHAWQVTVFSAVANRDKTLTLPGGTIVWDGTWAEADRSGLISTQVSAYLGDWAGLSQ